MIGRVVTVSPSEDKRYYLRLVLSHIGAPTSFDDFLTVNGQIVPFYQEVAFQMGLLQSNTYIEDTLDEVIAFQMPSLLKSLFALLLVFCSPSNPNTL
mgnify:CR=1 FL=1